MIRYFFCLLLLSLSNSLLFSQIEGDNIFGSDQVISIELTFPESDFYATLVSNYATETYTTANLTLTDITGTYSFDSVGVRLKGNSSYSHPGNKKSFKIDFNRYITGQDYDGLKKLNFSNGFKDPSLIREKVFFDVCRAADVPAPRANFANVYFNGTLWGFYTVVEQIDDQFLDWNIEEDNGNLFKAGDNFGGGPGGGDAADLLYYGASQASYEAKYYLKSNEVENDWTDLIELIDFINNSSAADFEAELENHIELAKFLRSVALDNLFSNLDTYSGSARNYYIYHNEDTDRWHWIKWDANESFGLYTNGVSSVTSLALDYVNPDRPLLENIFASDLLTERYEYELCYLTENFFNASYMNARVDAMVLLVQADVYADGNKMYSNADFDINVETDLPGGGGPGGGLIPGLKSFVAQRLSYLGGELDCTDFTGLNEAPALQFSFYPNPATNLLTLSFEHVGANIVSVIDMHGRTVLQNASSDLLMQFDISNLASGIYLLQLENEAAYYNEQILVIHR